MHNAIKTLSDGNTGEDAQEKPGHRHSSHYEILEKRWLEKLQNPTTRHWAYKWATEAPVLVLFILDKQSNNSSQFGVSYS